MSPFLSRLPASLVDRSGGDPAGPLRLRYLGTAGFVLEGAGRTVVVDPFLTRPGLVETGLSRLVPDEARLRRVLPRADEVLVGHSHFDHVLDAPVLCAQTGARLIGSPDVAMVGRAAGLPEHQIVETRGGDDIPLGLAGVVRGLPSRHGRVYGGRVTLPGFIPRPPPWPPRLTDLPHGLVLNWAIELAGVRVVHIDSADFIDAELAGRRCDVLCLCAIGRAWRPAYTRTAVELLRPKVVVACHWDWFFTPYEDEPLLLPGVDLPGFCAEIAEAGAEPVVLPFDGTYRAARQPD